MNDKKKLIAYLLISFIVLLMLCIWNDSRNAANGASRPVKGTIQQLETDSDRIGNKLDDAREQLEIGQEANSNAQGVLNDYADRNRESNDIIERSKEQLRQLKEQFADIERTN